MPVALLVTALRRRTVRVAVADLVLQLAGPVTVDAVRDALRVALRDPHLEVHLWPARPGRCAGPERLVVPVATAAGEPLAAIVADASLHRHRDLLDSAVAAAALALENARLQADLRAQLEQVSASRARIVEAGLIERRRLERDLHDGAQQRLLAVAATLAAARLRARPAAAVAAIDSARTELRMALQELRDLVHGIHPAVLSQGGLRPAIEVVAERLPLAVTIDVPLRRFEASAEATAYFVTCEALSNVVKHASASRAVVRVGPARQALDLEVIDDGLGGADPTRGAGLAGLADRVRALGGDLVVISPPGVGTLLTARIPCG